MLFLAINRSILNAYERNALNESNLNGNFLISKVSKRGQMVLIERSTYC